MQGVLSQPSPFWRKLSASHEKILQQKGLSEFKQSIPFKYFQWGVLGMLCNGFLPLVRARISRPGETLAVNSQRLHYPGASPLKRWVYATFLEWLVGFIRGIDSENWLAKIPEPEVGSPIAVRYQGNLVSQDLCHSLHEYYSIRRGAKDYHEILEIGAGYGRLAYTIKYIKPSVHYTIVDIPPAIHLSASYLKEVFPQAVFFGPKENFSWEKDSADFSRADFRFLFADQIRELPDGLCDLVVSVSSFHEMTQSQIAVYFDQFDRLGNGSFYLKQWKKSRARENGFRIRQGEYPIRRRWKKIFEETHPIQSLFFHALYEI